MTAGRSLTLLAPALFGPLPGLGEDQTAALADHLPELRALRTLAARGRRRPGVELEAALLNAFGHPADSGIAPLTRLADQGEPPAGYCLRADPVHLLAGQHNLVMAGAGEALGLEPDEAAACITTLNDLYAERGWWFEAPLQGRWYLHLPQTPGLTTTPLAAVMGRPVDEHLPTGAAARDWNGVLAEIQMALHAHPVNAERAVRGLPAVNSVWFWGGGGVPPRSPASGPSPQLWSDEPLALGLAHLHGVERHDRVDHATAWLAASAAGDHIVPLPGGRYSARESPGAWLDHLERLEQDWLGPLLAELRQRRLTRLTLLGSAAGIEVTPARLYRFWRRPQPLHRLLT